MKRIILLIIVFAIICYFQYSYINSHNNSYDILQYQNPNKAMFENIVQEKNITILTDIPTDELVYNKIPLKDLYQKTYDAMNNIQKTQVQKTITTNFEYYNIPLKTNSNANLYIQNKDTCGRLKKQTNYRFLLCVLKGTLKIALFSPNNSQYLYLNDNTKTSQVDVWNQDIKKYPLLEQAKYIEVLVHENQMIYIPIHWIYSTITINDCVYTTYTNESFFSSFLKKQ